MSDLTLEQKDTWFRERSERIRAAIERLPEPAQAFFEEWRPSIERLGRLSANGDSVHEVWMFVESLTLMVVKLAAPPKAEKVAGPMPEKVPGRGS